MSNRTIIVTLAIVFALAFIGCDNGDDPPPPHESTITAFGTTATVNGDASIPKADFEAAVGRLQSAVSAMNNSYSIFPQSWTSQLSNMMARGITIVAGNSAPASVSGALTVGAKYTGTIDFDIVALLNTNAFVD
jgi:hypothetical protein